MGKLKHTLTEDKLFKMYFVKNPDNLKRLVAGVLKVRVEDIREFVITNPELPPAALGKKFCRLDIRMIVDGQLVDLEIQVRDEGDYRDRPQYYWSCMFSSALNTREEYSELPRTMVISIVDFSLFDCDEYHSEFRPLEVTRHTLLSDKMCLHYFELPKLPELPETINEDNELIFWLSLFKADADEELDNIEEKGGTVMAQAVAAYRRIISAEEEWEWICKKAGHNEASALGHARRQERAKWEGVVAEKDAALAKQANALAEKDAIIAELKALIANVEKAGAR